MYLHKFFRIFCTSALLILGAFSPMNKANAGKGTEETPPPPQISSGERLGIEPSVMYGDENVSDLFIPFEDGPEDPGIQANSAASSFRVVFWEEKAVSGAGWAIPCNYGPTPMPAEAKVAVQRAVDIWSQIVNSPYNGTITVEICWQFSSMDFLTMSKSPYYYKNFPNAPYPDVLYPTGLANILAGYDVDGDINKPEIGIAINQRLASNFYYGTGITPANKYNFTSMILQQVANAMGFSSSISLTTNNDYQITSAGWGEWKCHNIYDSSEYCRFSYGDPLLPNPFDRLITDLQSRQLINGQVYSNDLLKQILLDGPIYFVGPMSRSANNGVSVLLEKPNHTVDEYNIHHINDSYNGTENALLTHSLSLGETIYNPGPIAKAMLADLGWPIPEYQVAPTDITLTNNKVAENLSAGTKVGAFTSIDRNPGTVFTYTLVAGAGSDHNSFFKISGNTLYTAQPFDFEIKSTYSIRVRTTDLTNRSFEKVLSITITDVNENPSDIQLSNQAIAENMPPGTVVGILSTTDPISNSHTYIFPYNTVTMQCSISMGISFN